MLCPESVRNVHCYHRHPYTPKEKGITSWTTAPTAWDQGSYKSPAELDLKQRCVLMSTVQRKSLESKDQEMGE